MPINQSDIITNGSKVSYYLFLQIETMFNWEQSAHLTVEHLEFLAELVGKDWLDSQLERYRRFRKHYSTPSRWWHRLPDVSPIIPLVLWAEPGPLLLFDSPFGVWRGDARGILARLMMGIDEFREYWDQLPEGRGRKHLKYNLRHPSTFFGFRHELRLATHLTSSGYHIVPLFFDPTSIKGGPDIIVEDGPNVYDIQCKSRNPSTATDMPYDVFQFFACSWVRLVKDSGHNYFLFLVVKKKIDMAKARRLLHTLQALIRTKLAVSTHLESDDWSIQLREIGYGPGMITPEEQTNMAHSQSGDPLYIELELIRPASKISRSPHFVGCYITGGKGPGLEHYVFSAAERAARAHIGDNPLIVSVNLYQETDMFKYMNGSRVKPLYDEWKERFFSNNRRVAMLLMSANYDRYLPIDDTRIVLGTKYLVEESPYWDKVLLCLGIS